MKKIVYDIETVADWSMSSDMMVRLGSKSSRSQGKLNFSPLAIRIICIGANCIGEVEPVVFTGEDEKKILTDWVNYINSLSGEMPYRMIGFNCQSFDYPNILFKLALHGIPRPRYFPDNKKYGSEYHVDMRSLLTNYDTFASGTLEDWCCRHGIEFEDLGHGEDVQGWWNNEDMRHKIADHCKQDLQLTAQLYLKHENYLPSYYEN